MKRILIPVALLLFSAGVYFLFVLPNQIEQKFKDAVPENVEVNYKDFQVNLLDKSVVVETLKLEDLMRRSGGDEEKSMTDMERAILSQSMRICFLTLTVLDETEKATGKQPPKPNIPGI